MSKKPLTILSDNLPKTIQDLLRRRERLLGPYMSTFYEEPLHLIKGEGVWVWDSEGRKYLDCYNNVPHVGHCHPKVVEAICQQAGKFNSHTRYLHEGILDYVEKLTASFDASLSTAIMTCTGSEANDVAMRIARAVTGKTGIIATDHTYHGNTIAVSQLSFTNPPPGGKWPNVKHVTAPDSYRPQGGVAGQAHAQAFAAELEMRIAELDKSGHGFSALILCPYFANEGFPDLEADWFKPVISAVRKAGGLIIADEVQPGFGRLGTHMWAHQRYGFVPDIVTIGKPMANGHPVGAVITQPDYLASFRQTYKYFNTFGGNPVSCAAAMATLNVIEEEGLMENAFNVGRYAKERLQNMAKRHEYIGDVRGQGLFFGAEMVLDKSTKEPATSFTQKVANEMRRRGILLNFLGIHYNTLKCRPPMTFSKDNADFLLDTLDEVLTSIDLT